MRGGRVAGRVVVVWVVIAMGAGCPAFDTQAIVNQPPVAEATGPGDPVVGGEEVTLHGRAEDAEGDPLNYRWEQIAGDAVALSSQVEPVVTFIAPQRAQTLVFAFTAHDGYDESNRAIVQVQVVYNRPPVADAGGAYEVGRGQPVRLSGSATDPDGDPIVAWQWLVDAAPPGSSTDGLLSGADSRFPIFTPDVKGEYTVSLVVFDGIDHSLPDHAFVTARNNPPVADAGPHTATPNRTPVVLEGSAEDPDGDPIVAWEWSVASFPPGASFELLNAESATPTFTPHGRGVYLLSLVVRDDEGAASPPSQVMVEATNNPPAASVETPPGQDRYYVTNRQPISIQGAGTDPDGDPLTFAWQVASAPAGAGHQLSGADRSEVTFVPHGKGTYDLELRVHDGTVASEPATVRVEATNAPPVADAGPDLFGLAGGNLAVLDGTGSHDPDGDPLTYTWTQLDGDPVRFLAADGAEVMGEITTTSPTQSFLAPSVLGYATLQLVVDDGEATSPPDTVRIRVDHLPPIADAGGPLRYVEANTEVVLDGTASHDPQGGDTLFFEWTQTTGPEVLLLDAGTATPRFIAPPHDPVRPEAVVFRLRVSNGFAWSAPDTVTLHVTPGATDFVFVDNAAAPADPGGSWGGTGTRDDPVWAVAYEGEGVGAIGQAILLAEAAGKDVAVAGGLYEEHIRMVTGVSIYGGYGSGTWVRDPAAHETRIDDAGETGWVVIASDVAGVGEDTVLDGMTLRKVTDAHWRPANNSTHAGVYCNGCHQVVIRDVRISLVAPNPPPHVHGIFLRVPGSVTVEGSSVDVRAGTSTRKRGIWAINATGQIVLRGNHVRLTNFGNLNNAGIGIHRSDGAVVDGNVVVLDDAATCGGSLHGIRTPMQFFSSGDGTDSGLHQGTVVNNVVRLTGTRCPEQVGIYLGNSHHGNVVANNLVSGAPGGLDSTRIGLRIDRSGTDDTLVANNVFEDLDVAIAETAGLGEDVLPLLRANAFHDAPVLYRHPAEEGEAVDLETIAEMEALPAPAGTPGHGGNLLADCGVRDLPGGDYTLAADSPCLGQGERMDRVPEHDKVGTPRPQPPPAGVVPFADGTDIGPMEAVSP